MDNQMIRGLLVLATLLPITPSLASHSDDARLEFARAELPAAPDELLPPDEAFGLSTRSIDATTLEARWQIADGYYLYQNRFKFEAQDNAVTLGLPGFPAGERKSDPLFGEVETYSKQVAVRLPIARRDSDALTTTLRVTAQGCNEPVGVCYPPIIKHVAFNLISAAVAETVTAGSGAASVTDLRQLLAPPTGEQEFLHPDDAFVLTVEPVADDVLLARFQISEGYYLYRDKTKFELSTAAGAAPTAARLTAYELPAGKPKFDEYFGETEVYYHQTAVSLPLATRTSAPTNLELKAVYQGCAEKGICYPPISKYFDIRLANTGIVGVTSRDPLGPRSPIADAGAITSTSFLLAIILAFGTGLLLTFTPCVLPMIPILSSIIVGQGANDITKVRGGMLSLTFVLGTAVTYTAIGIVAGATGDQLQAYFQNTWAIGVLSAIFVAMALSMFGLYELQMPSFIQSRLQQTSQGLQGGSLAGTFGLGVVSALIVGACVSPLLISALGVAIASRDPVLGGAMMFSMALGMGVILIACGVGAGWLLPRAGQWMEKIKQGFGVLLLAVAIYLLGFLPNVPILFLWAAFFVGMAIYLGATQSLPRSTRGWRFLWKGLETGLLVWGILALVGGLSGHRDVLRPVPTLLSGSDPSVSVAAGHSLFERITELAILEDRLTAARLAGRPVIVDYYADWCTDCVRMERLTFANADVRAALEPFVLLQLDVTNAFDPQSSALKKHFGVYGPPATVFITASGDERRDLRFYGFRSANQFLQILNKLAPTIARNS
jgi:thiol:disulfide interchange protein DsbD